MHFQPIKFLAMLAITPVLAVPVTGPTSLQLEGSTDLAVRNTELSTRDEDKAEIPSDDVHYLAKRATGRYEFVFTSSQGGADHPCGPAGNIRAVVVSFTYVAAKIAGHAGQTVVRVTNNLDTAISANIKDVTKGTGILALSLDSQEASEGVLDQGVEFQLQDRAVFSWKSN